MKKILKYYLPLTISFLALGIFFLLYMIQGHLAVLKYFAGELSLEGKGKIISEQLKAVVKEDGIEQKQIKLFEDEGKIYIIFQKTGHPGFGVLIVDKEKKDIFTPLVSSNCYGLVFSSYLFQAECGQRGDYYGGEKHEGYSVKMESNDSQISFQLPVYNDGKLERDRKIEIIVKGE
jgi:hypothetical protein